MERLAQIGGTIQGYLYSYLAEETEPLTNTLKQPMLVLEIVHIESIIRTPHCKKGRLPE